MPNRQLLGTYDLLNRHTGHMEDASLFDAISDENVEHYEKSWLPESEARLQALPGLEAGIVGEANIQDVRWDWRAKVDDTAPLLAWESYALECAGMTQGLMLINMEKRARIAEQKNRHLVAIEFVATAPWNRVGFTDKPLYKGVGPLMLGTAISRSVDAGFKGLIGLHALPQAEEWYRDVCGMQDLGPDPAYQNLHYFEMTEPMAMTFIGQS